MSKRVAINICAWAVPATEAHNSYQVVVALCNDGTLWELEQCKWTQLPSIPQPGDDISHD